MRIQKKHTDTFLSNNIDKETGFSIPQNYFEGIEDDFFGKLTTQKRPTTEGFIVPENYFDSLETAVLQKISTKKTITLKTKILRLIPVAAAASILLFIGTTFFAKNTKTINFDTITADEITLWVFEGYTNFTTTDLAFTLETSEINELNETTITINNNDIEQYFNNNIDTYTLFNELE